MIGNPCGYKTDRWREMRTSMSVSMDAMGSQRGVKSFDSACEGLQLLANICPRHG